MTLLSWCGVSASSAAVLVAVAAVRRTGGQTALRALWSVLLVLGEVLPLPLLWIAWQSTTFVIPFLGPPVRIGLLPVWWALAAVAFSYVAAIVDVVRFRHNWMLTVFPPVHAFAVLLREWL